VLRKWLDKSLKHPVKSAKLTKALTYLNSQWHKLIRYKENGAWPIDNEGWLSTGDIASVNKNIFLNC
jgi:hypothetical protein